MYLIARLNSMTSYDIWFAILGLTAITVLSRSLFLIAGTSIKIPHNMQRALRYAPAAALVALPDDRIDQRSLAGGLT